MRTRPLILSALTLAAAFAFVAWCIARAAPTARPAAGRAAERPMDAGVPRAWEPPLPVEEAAAERSAVTTEAPAEPLAEAEEEPEDESDAPLPPDPLELGECELLLQIFERTTREPVAARVHLWRLDAPGNEDWTSGDRCRAVLLVAAGGSWIRELPEGRYRVRCDEERSDNDDPQEFTVRCPTTVQRIDVDLPRAREVSLRIYRADGEPILEAEAALAETGGSSHQPGDPPWVKSRKLKGDRESSAVGVGGGWSGRSGPRPRAMQAGEDGWFQLGSIREGDRNWTPSYVIDARVDGLSKLTHRFDGDVESTRFVAVLIDPAPIQRSVITPDGRTCAELERGLTVRSRALPVSADPPPDAWREAPLEASRRWKPDFEDFQLEFRLSDLPLPTRVLEPKGARDG